MEEKEKEVERVKEIDSLAQACLLRKKTYLARKAAKLGASQEMKDQVVKASLEKSGTSGSLLDAAEELRPSQFIIDSIVKTCVRNDYIDGALRAARLGASDETKNELVIDCCARGLLKEAREAAEIRGKKLSQKEIDNIVVAAYPKQNFSTAIEAAKEASTEMKQELLNFFLERGLVEYIAEAVQLQGRNLSTDEIKRLEEAVLKRS